MHHMVTADSKEEREEERFMVATDFVSFVRGMLVGWNGFLSLMGPRSVLIRSLSGKRRMGICIRRSLTGSYLSAFHSGKSFKILKQQCKVIVRGQRVTGWVAKASSYPECPLT